MSNRNIFTDDSEKNDLFLRSMLPIGDHGVCAFVGIPGHQSKNTFHKNVVFDFLTHKTIAVVGDH